MFRRSSALLKKKHVENWKAISQSSAMQTVRNARQVLIQLYRKTLEDVKVIPTTSAYRQNVEAIVRYRLSVCEMTNSNNEIEMACEAGMIEDQLLQAKMELELIPFMARLKPWEVPDDWEPPRFEVDQFEFDWRKLREDRLRESYQMRMETSEQEKAEMMQQWLTNSNPDLEIYPPEMANFIFRARGVVKTAFKRTRFGP